MYNIVLKDQAYIPTAEVALRIIQTQRYNCRAPSYCSFPSYNLPISKRSPPPQVITQPPEYQRAVEELSQSHHRHLKHARHQQYILGQRAKGVI